MPDSFLLSRVRLVRRLALWGPWAVLAFSAVTQQAPQPMTDATRTVLSVALLIAGAVALVAWIAVRGRARWWPWGAALATTFAFWVAVLGAMHVGRGARLEWFVLPYLWVLAVTGVLFRDGPTSVDDGADRS